MMKRAFLICILFLTVLVSLTGCIMIPIHKQYDIDPKEVSSIEIYDLRGGGYLSAETLAYTIEEDQTEDFLRDLSDIRFTDHIIITIAAIDPSFDYGEWTVRVNYTDGSYSFISCAGYGETYDANNEVIDCNHFECETYKWKALIRKYVPEEIFGEQE